MKRRWFCLPAIAVPVLLGGCGSASMPASSHTATRHRVAVRSPPVASLVARPAGELPAPVQFPAMAALGDRLLLMGGLDQATASVADIVSVEGGTSRRLGTLPYPVHDAAGASIGGRAYLLGGGEPSHGEILGVEPTGRVSVAGHLPAGASDVAAGVLGGTVYVVGGYTGTAPLDTIVAWSGSGVGRVVARLPHPVRYAAVTAIGGRLVVAGGTSGDQATRDVYSFDPVDGHVRDIGLLPRALTHAAAAALAGRVFVIGGRGAIQGSQTAAILAIDPVSGRVRPAGRLPVGLSDLGAATVGGAIMIAGGRQSSGVLSRTVYRLRPAGPA